MKKYIWLSLLLSCCVIADTSSTQTLMIKLKVADTHYELLDSWLLSRAYPATVDAPSDKELRWQLLDANHQLIREGWIQDPQLVTSALLEDTNGAKNTYKHNGSYRQNSATVILRVPYDPRMQILQIEKQPAIAMNPGASSGKQEKPAASGKSEFTLSPRPAQ